MVFLAFRPRLVLKTVLTYPGRIVMLVDDSFSMLSPDPAMDRAQALRIARNCGLEVPGTIPIAQKLYGELLEVRADVLSFERFSRNADRARNQFWDRAGRMRRRVESYLDEVQAQLPSAASVAGIKTDELVPVRKHVKELRARLDNILTGQQHPGSEAFDRYHQTLAGLGEQLLALVDGRDARVLDRGDEQLAEVAQRVRGSSRLDLVRSKLEPLTFPHVQVRRLSKKTGGEREDFQWDELQAVAPQTPLLAELKRLLEAPSEFPLSGIVVLSDGRDTASGSLPAVVGAATRRKVPVFVASAGLPGEPPDNALLGRVVAPIGVKGQEVNVQVLVKAACVPKEEEELVLELHGNGEKILQKKLPIGGQTYLSTNLSFTPEEAGRHRYVVSLQRDEREVFPSRNNSRSFSLFVRESDTRVLFLDWKPRWESRFVLNVLRRLDYVDLNGIVGILEKDQSLRRGVTRGTWPRDYAALRMYDVVIIGDIPPGTLKAEEWDQLDRLVSEEGKTLCLLGSSRESIGNEIPLESATALYDRSSRSRMGAGLQDAGDPVRPGSEGTNGTASLVLTPAGILHPLTRALRGTDGKVVSAGNGVVEPAVGRRTLLVGRRDQGAVATIHFPGNGRLLHVTSQRLWEKLNRHNYAGHQNLYLNLLTWALTDLPDAAGPAAEPRSPRLYLDSRSARVGQRYQLWARAAKQSRIVEARQGGETVAQVELSAPYAGGVIPVVFEDLPPGRVAFRFADRPGSLTPPVDVRRQTEELNVLSRNSDLLREMAGQTGGRYAQFWEVDQLLPEIEPKSRTETHRSTYRLWDAGLVLVLLVILIAVELVWRKFAGLV
jgi:hypothetical protein